MKKTKVLVVVAQYYLNDKSLAKYLKHLKSMIFSMNLEEKIIIINMRDFSKGPIELYDNRFSFPFLDISAYCLGLDNFSDEDCTIVLNDTLFKKHPWRGMLKELINLIPLLKSLDIPAVAGAVHPDTDILMLNPNNPNRQHLSTFLFAANEAAVKIFKTITAQLNNELDKNGESWLKKQLLLHAHLKLLLKVNLGGVVNPWMWPRLRKGPAKADLINSKSVAVAVEYLYTNEILQEGGCILPINKGLIFKIKCLLFTKVMKRLDFFSRDKY